MYFPKGLIELMKLFDCYITGLVDKEIAQK